MTRYNIKARAIVEIELSVEAKSEDHARQLLDDNIALNAAMVDMSDADYMVCEDSISQLDRVEVTEE